MHTLAHRSSSLCSMLAAGALALMASLAAPVAAQQGAAARDWAVVDQALGRTGAAQPGGVMKYSFPRSDLHVTVAGVSVRPALALGSWIAFKDVGGGKVMAMGDLVLTEDEVAPVMRALQQGGVEQTAVHNHLLHESPRVMYMHVAAHGARAAVARAIRAALAESRTPLAAPASPSAPQAAPPAEIDLDTAGIARVLGVSGKVNGGVYQVSVPRRETIRENGHEVPPAMGVATGINFQSTGGGKAAVTGDFVMRASEVNHVISALEQGGITVTALHSHMLDEQPRLFFMHFWANDDVVALARTLRTALRQTQSKVPAR